jgi:hypothetical protein
MRSRLPLARRAGNHEFVSESGSIRLPSMTVNGVNIGGIAQYYR